jgi:acyl-[acyl-carrier-protein]-phospholipid O-acyltransferase/long-chain-fatty-acid--[acyl-carrier-protein] ligase
VSFVRKILFAAGRAMLRALYRVEVRGLENFTAAGSRVIVLPNHTSLLDAALAALFVPGNPVFAVNKFVAENWRWVKPFLRLIKTWPIDPTSPFSLKGLIAEIKRDACCVFFPEGRITTTGAIMKIYDGAAMLADKADAVLLPLRIDGAVFSKASYMKGKYPLRNFPKITMTFLPPCRPNIPDLKGRRRREAVRKYLHDLMRDGSYSTLDGRMTVWDALTRARGIYGGRRPVALDINRRPATYDDIVTASIVLGEKLAPLVNGERVGILLPGAIPTVAAVLGLSRMGFVPSMLNYTSGSRNIISCCFAAQITTVVSSRKFVASGKLGAITDALSSEGLDIIWLEDVSQSVTATDRLFGFLRARFAVPHDGRSPDSAALVLFTSGSEGTPKGVVLSHANIIANRNQLISSIDFNPSDVVMNAMPMFHVLGFVVGTLMPLFTGILTFYYPNPLHYRVIPVLSYDIDATVLFGTDTFLYAYARSAHPYDFYRTRYVFAGAEKLRDHTRALWAEKFGIRIIEGYGTTETAIISANTPLQFKAGTVGRALSAMECRTEPVQGIERGGRFFVRGPNVMLGYLRAGAGGEIEPPEGGWYDTGDIIEEDESGFLTIMGRAKRFAKIGGEMVSLASLEDVIERLWSGARHAVAAVPDERKGETLVLATEYGDATREELAAYLKEAGFSETHIPKRIVKVASLPLLGSGKIDYPAVSSILN